MITSAPAAASAAVPITSVSGPWPKSTVTVLPTTTTPFCASVVWVARAVSCSCTARMRSSRRPSSSWVVHHWSLTDGLIGLLAQLAGAGRAPPDGGRLWAAPFVLVWLCRRVLRKCSGEVSRAWAAAATASRSRAGWSSASGWLCQAQWDLLAGVSVLSGWVCLQRQREVGRCRARLAGRGGLGVKKRLRGRPSRWTNCRRARRVRLLRGAGMLDQLCGAVADRSAGVRRLAVGASRSGSRVATGSCRSSAITEAGTGWL